jgi:hypothetical protein
VRIASAISGARRVGTADCAPCKSIDVVAAFAHPTDAG